MKKKNQKNKTEEIVYERIVSPEETLARIIYQATKDYENFEKNEIGDCQKNWKG